MNKNKVRTKRNKKSKLNKKNVYKGKGGLISNNQNNDDEQGNYGGLFNDTKRYFFGNQKKTKKVGYAAILDDTKNSETNLLNSYDALTKNVNEYYKSYNNHLENLITLEDFVNLDSLDTIFKDIIVKKHFKREDVIDRSNPLLINNYLVTDETSPKDFRKEHIIKQIRYKLHQDFPDREQLLIKDIDVKKDTDNVIIMIITTIEDKKYNRSIHHNNYVLQLPQVRKDLKDIISSAKKNLKYESNIHKFEEDSLSRYTSSNKNEGVDKYKRTDNSNNNLISKNQIISNQNNNGPNNRLGIFNNLSDSNISNNKRVPNLNIPPLFELESNIPNNNKQNLMQTGPLINKNCEDVTDEKECRNLETEDGKKKCFYDRMLKKCTKNKKLL